MASTGLCPSMRRLERIVPIKFVDQYEIDYTAEPLHGCGQWGAYVAIFMPSANPMHRTNIFPKQRVAADLCLATEAEAHEAAQVAGVAILERLRHKPGV